MTRTIADHVIAVLEAAGPEGLTARQIAAAVTVARGKPTLQETIFASISAYRTTHRGGPQLRTETVNRLRRWILAPSAPPPEPAIASPSIRPDDRSIRPHSLTAALLGDPLPGRSAYDHRQFEKARSHA